MPSANTMGAAEGGVPWIRARFRAEHPVGVGVEAAGEGSVLGREVVFATGLTEDGSLTVTLLL